MQPDEIFMYQALQLAERGRYTARPNPMVGALLVQNGQVIGEGFHAQAGLAHAERALFEQHKHPAAGATLYVTLEPCTHTGKTPPCIDLVLQHKPKRVVIAAADPNPLVCGRGIEKLIEHGVEVTLGVLQDQAVALNRGFFLRMQHQRPYVRAKVAMSLDGKVAMSNGESQWITGGAARQAGHLWRARSGAIITTYETVRQDDCQLTVRNPALIEVLPENTVFQPPIKVILDQALRSAPSAKIFAQGRVVVAVGLQVSKVQIAEFLSALPKNHQVEVISFPTNGAHLAFDAILQYLAELQINDVLIEAGPRLLTALLEQQHVDELVIYMAPDLLGQQTMSMQSLQISSLKDRLEGQFHAMKKVGRDLEVTLLLSDWAKTNTAEFEFQQEFLCNIMG